MKRAAFAYIEFFGNPDTAALVGLWERSWRYWGWETHILTAEWAMRHPLHDRLVERVSQWPTGATVPFNIAAARRWCAMAAIGGGMQSDPDIMNYGLTPEDAARYGTLLYGAELPSTIIMFDDLAAGPAWGNATAYEDCVKFMIEADYKEKYKSQCCEMMVLRDYHAKRIPLAPEMTLKDWKTAPLCHFGNGRWQTAFPGVPRSIGIPTVRPLKLAGP